MSAQTLARSCAPVVFGFARAIPLRAVAVVEQGSLWPGPPLRDRLLTLDPGTLRRSGAHVPRGHSEARLEVPAKLGLIAEPPPIGDLADALSPICLRELRPAGLEPHVPDPLRDRGPAALKEGVEIAQRDIARARDHL